MEKRLQFMDSGADIGNFVLVGNNYQALENKIFFLLAKLGAKDATNLKGGILWGKFEAFKNARDSLVHPRRYKEPDLQPEEVEKHIDTAQELIQEISQRIWNTKLEF